MPDLITTRQAARKLGVTARRVRQIINELSVRPQTIGGAIVLDPAQFALMSQRNTKRGKASRTEVRGSVSVIYDD